MALRDQIRPLLESLVGGDPVPTVTQRRPNWVDSLDDTYVYVHTKRSRANGRPDPVPLDWLYQTADLLEQRQVIHQHDVVGMGAQFRHEFVFAVLCQLDGVTCQPGPPAVVALETG